MAKTKQKQEVTINTVKQLLELGQLIQSALKPEELRAIREQTKRH